jgi:hypothetical protein
VADRGDGSADAYGNAFALEDIAQQLRCLGLLRAEEPGAGLDHRHGGAETAERLRELQADGAATDHRE